MRVLFANFIYAACFVLLMTAYALLPLDSEAHALARAVLIQNGFYFLGALAMALAALERISGKSVLTRVREALPAAQQRRSAKPFNEVNFSQ